MAFSDFTLEVAKTRLDVRTREVGSLFPNVVSAPISDFLRMALQSSLPLALRSNTEKARSEWIVAPILLEIVGQMGGRVNIFSGVPFRVEPEHGLEGFCDFLISASPEPYYVDAPVLVIVEAKREDLVAGLGQTLATMVAAERFNRARNSPADAIYGSVTSGTNWKFLQLKSGECRIESGEHFVDDPGHIVGVFKAMLDATGLVPAEAEPALLD